MESKEPASNGNGTDITEGLKEGDEMGIWYDLASAPCFRQSLLYGLGGGGAIGALNLLRNRDGMRAAETMVKTGCGIALLNWMVCRHQYYLEREMTYAGMERHRQQAAAKSAAYAKQMREKQMQKTNEEGPN